MPLFERSVLRRLLPAALLLSALAGCAGPSPYDKLEAVTPSGSAFSRALYKDYAHLARSLGLQNAPAATSFDSTQSYSLSGIDANVADVADTFARKAVRAANGEEPLPEPTPPDNSDAEIGRQKLLRALDQGRKMAPQLAARTQVDYDCWVLDATVDSLSSSSARCQQAFNRDLKRLEQGGNPGVAQEAPAQQSAPSQQTAQAPAQQSATAKTVGFTVYFALDSALLDAKAQAVLHKVIATARAGRQTRITVVGHTDTVGTEAFNKTLSERRAEAVKSALVSMGARAEAVDTSGTGENDLAVPTPNGVPNPKNRRAVITLVP